MPATHAGFPPQEAPATEGISVNTARRIAFAALSGLLLCAACADRQAASGPTVILHEDGKIRRVPAADFNEAACLKRGYMKNTDGRGDTIYVFVPETDRPPETNFGQNIGKGRAWYGDRGGGQGRGGMGAVGLTGGNWRR